MRKTRSLLPLLALVGLGLLLPTASRAGGRRHHGHGGICRATAAALASACPLEANEDARVAWAVCLNLTDKGERRECGEEARDDFLETLVLCHEQARARRALCRVPGFGGAYDPEIDPADFTPVIDNPYAPFAVGRRWVYQKDGEEGRERVVVEVLDETREIAGVECAVVRDRVFLDGELVEDTRDWVAQDGDGNVWYFGEIAKNFEDGRLHDLEGSWETGRDGAKPGFWVKADPHKGELYRQEWLPGEAEDVVEVLSTNSPKEVPFANGRPVLKTRDFTPLEPDAEEFKFYVPGVGLVLELDPESGETLELVEFTP